MRNLGMVLLALLFLPVIPLEAAPPVTVDYVKVVSGAFRREIIKPPVDAHLLIPRSMVQGFVYLTISAVGEPYSEITIFSSLVSPRFGLAGVEYPSAVVKKQTEQSITIKFYDNARITLQIEGMSPETRNWTLLWVMSEGPVLTIAVSEPLVEVREIKRTVVATIPGNVFQLTPESIKNVVGLWQNTTVYLEKRRMVIMIKLAERLAERGLDVDEAVIEVDRSMLSPYIRAEYENRTDIVSGNYSMKLNVSRDVPKYLYIEGTTPDVKGIKRLNPVLISLYLSNGSVERWAFPTHVITEEALQIQHVAELEEMNSELEEMNSELEGERWLWSLFFLVIGAAAGFGGPKLGGRFLKYREEKRRKEEEYEKLKEKLEEKEREKGGIIRR